MCQTFAHVSAEYFVDFFCYIFGVRETFINGSKKCYNPPIFPLVHCNGTYLCSVADPYHFDPDPGCENFRYGSGSRVSFDTDPDPGS